MELTNLKRPLVIGSKTIRNRVVVPPMADIALQIPNGYIHDGVLERYGAYADGGAGLIIVEGSNVTSMPDVREAIALWSDDYLPGLAVLAQRIKRNGVVALIQIMNIGLRMMPYETMAAIPRERFLQYQADFVAAARRCQQAGFDGIELHGAHGYFLDEIVETSTRHDEYGGSLENRVRYSAEIIETIKKQCGANFLVSIRFGYHEMSSLIYMAKAWERAGADILHVSMGTKSYKGIPQDFPMDSKLYAAWQVKQHVQVPVIGVGNIRYGEDAEKALRNGYADLIAIGRSHWADPAWTNHVFQGKEPIHCYRCKPCQWFKDGRRCPARNRRHDCITKE